MHPDNPAILTGGRYYFVPDDTPMYPGTHFLDWRGWTSDERAGMTLGQWDGADRFDKGNPPPLRALVKVVGDPRCIADGGGGYTTNVDDTGLQRWLPLSCYPPATFCNQIEQCPLIWQYSWVLEAVFTNPVLARARAQELLGPTAEVATYTPAAGGLFSGSLVAKVGRTAYQFIDGTRNRDQLLAQIYGGINGVTDFGRYTASRIYQDYATQCLMRFSSSECDDCNRWVLIGHSYGGAAASVVAARLRITRPDDEIVLMTMGAPRAGGTSLIETLRLVCQSHIRRFRDPIPYLPPTLTSGLPQAIEQLTGLNLWDRWGVFRQYEFRRYINGGVFQDPRDDMGPDDGVMATIIGQLDQNLNVEISYASHAITAYTTDLRSTCEPPTNTSVDLESLAALPAVDCCGG